ncbi:general substrate transporter [Colletotrichum navitas]|uniref:General substrate transporter n=1 Tax=Colletotrichum navitas TaxID=681940 RepID=A0AAD8PLS7_9PEZI|nr:general substrate transporter [Colletotrichum navitas]KAK1570043.1 general substrate transporter [Colletotrichum navitas]
MAWLGMTAPPGELRLYFLCIYFGVGASVWGYNIGVMSTVISNYGFDNATGHMPLFKKGYIISSYYIGTSISYLLLSHPLSDWLGRRHAALVGTIVVCIGALFQAISNGPTGLGTMIAGRIVSGLGVAIVSTSVPLYQAEVSPAKKRGHFVTVNHVGFIAGIATGLWVGYFMRFWRSRAGDFWGWRLSILLEIVPALIFGLGLPWIPETPRWLVEHGKKDKARLTLYWLREGNFDGEQINREFSAIIEDVDEYHHSGFNWLSLLKEKALFARLWRATLLQFMAQLCGASGIKYYLPYLLRSLGLSMKISVMVTAIEMTVKIFFTVLEMFIIDRFGRRNCLATGCAIMAVSLLINAALPLVYGYGENTAASVVCIIFIFVYAMGFSIGFGPVTWVYNTEIFPTSVRARGLNFASVGGSVGATIVTIAWSYGLSFLGNYIYFLFAAINLACIPVVYTFFPETKGRGLEEMDAIFGAVDKPRSDSDDASVPLLRDDASYRDSEDSAPGTSRDEDHGLNLTG